MVNDSRCQEDIGEAVLYPGRFYPGAEVVCFRPRPLARTGTSVIVNTGLQAPSSDNQPLLARMWSRGKPSVPEIVNFDSLTRSFRQRQIRGRLTSKWSPFPSTNPPPGLLTPCFDGGCVCVCVCVAHISSTGEPSGMDYNFLNTIHYVPLSTEGSRS